MWRDELQAWLITKGSTSVAQLLQNIRYEGHPSLWYLSLYPLTRFTDQPFAMQILHLLIATTTVYLLARWSPFTPIQKGLIAFSYFFSFEYAIISRNYALGLLFTFLFCALFCAARPRPILLAFVLVFLAHSNLHATILAIAFGLAWGFHALLTVPRPRPRSAARALVALLVVVFGIAAVIIQIASPPDSPGVARLSTFLSGGTGDDSLPQMAVIVRRTGGVIASFWRSYVPIPRPTFHFWGSNLLDDLPPAQAVLSVPLLLVSLLVVAYHPVALLLWISGTIGLFAFWYLRHAANLYHYGYIFILYIAASWVSASSLPSPLKSAFSIRMADLSTRWRPRFTTTLLAVHVLAGAYATTIDLLFPFSGSREVARFIQERYPPDVPIVAVRDSPGSAVAGYLNRELYYPSAKRYGTFVILDNRRRVVTAEQLLRQLNELLEQKQQGALLLVSDDAENLAPLRSCLEPVYRSRPSIVPSERYSLYAVSSGDLKSCEL